MQPERRLPFPGTGGISGIMARLILLISALFAFAAPSARADDVQDAQYSADAAGRVMREKYGSAEVLKHHLSVPLTGGGAMTTVDGTRSFTARVACPHTQKFLELLVNPGTSGDLSPVTISMDLDMDGIEDYIFQAPVRASGVCGNGIISCDEGTWNHCQGYQWAADSAGRVRLDPAGMTQLGGCYCVNVSCLTGSLSNHETLSLILRDVGSGAAGAVQSANPKFAISDARIISGEFRALYYGQNMESCEKAGQETVRTNPELYFGGGSGSGLDSAKTTEILDQREDPASYYSLLTQSGAAVDMRAALPQCSIRRRMTVERTDECPQGGGFNQADGLCTDPDPACGARYCLSMTEVPGPGCAETAGTGVNLTVSEGYDWWFTINHVVCSGQTLCLKGPQGQCFQIPGMNCSYDLPLEEGRLVTRMVGNGEGIDIYAALYGCPGGSSQNEECPPGRDNRQVGRVSTPGVFVVGDAGNFSSYPIDRVMGDGSSALRVHAGMAETAGLWSSLGFYRPQCRYPAATEDRIIESFDNQCLAYENDANCIIKDEKADGVAVLRHYSLTGISPVSSCKTVTGWTSHSVCKDWWQKDRTYLCKGEDYDFTDTKKRMKKIQDSTSGDTGSMIYGDTRKNVDGSWTTETGISVGIGTLRPHDGRCTKACRTRRAKPNTQAGVSGHAQVYQFAEISYDYFYRSCVKEASCPAGAEDTVCLTCPVQAGEEMVDPCGCVNDFTTAASVMAAIDEASKDIICSSGARR